MSQKSANKKQFWLKDQVISGSQYGHLLGYPTINLKSIQHMADHPEGVYATQVKIKGKLYTGALYFGPNYILGKAKSTVEIYVFDFHHNVYGETIFFQLGEYIRPPIQFSNKQEFKRQLTIDCRKIIEIAANISK